MRRGTHDLSGDVSPSLADAGTSDDVLAVWPLVLGGVDAPYDLAEKLRQHGRPRIAVAVVHDAGGGGGGGGVERGGYLEGSGEFARTKDLPQRHGC